MNVIELKDIVKTYDMGGAEEVHALRGRQRHDRGRTSMWPSWARRAPASRR